MAKSTNAAMAKLALGIAGVAALAGVTGRLAAANPPPPVTGGADAQQEAQTLGQDAAALQRSLDQGQRLGGAGDDHFFFRDDEGEGDHEREGDHEWEGDEEGEDDDRQGFVLVPPQPPAGSPHQTLQGGSQLQATQAASQLQAPQSGTPSQPVVPRRTRTRRS